MKCNIFSYSQNCQIFQKCVNERNSKLKFQKGCKLSALTQTHEKNCDYNGIRLTEITSFSWFLESTLSLYHNHSLILYSVLLKSCPNKYAKIDVSHRGINEIMKLMQFNNQNHETSENTL
jgi:hypothetical protein